MEDSGNSESSTAQSTSSSTTDARVGADNGANVFQGGSVQNISFSPEVANLGKGIVDAFADFSKGVVSETGDILKTQLDLQKSQTETILNFGKVALASSPAVSDAASSRITSSLDLNSLKIPLIIGAAVIAFLIFRRK